ncbi:ribonuclease III [Zunongwangia profunda]|jgi:ribonuclease-3|uniref:Ribonuclease 3 n=2 Tax=Zunongwangia profunda TaxID=398743 RepID=RNC_ZUNPS|nr:ribonuclease III [Zunongwangia profunda]D5BDP9.2 RecName: Full=Ribonuclease 3; AltName: Full=Ribonuclease III; Short=RNase III [Zunongwangia profunda SM-A87]MAC65541.1 ribonuclease 3 [Flavobacteriaceae bacterium]MAS69880.1 ribonuclease 3 [Zunongwangia sp.]HCV83151.1 ribonuclease III [Zunongwangia profunda]|tara:strand:- start:16872 stop:17603 length:732 start_codon:yes stop_codon:yes gene_type:complete
MSVIRNILNSRSSKGGNFFNTLHKLLGFRPKDLSVYERAFTHRSLNVKDPSGNPINYERLEFLGDAMLGSVIASHLYQEVPEGDEGYLTKMRSKIVSRKHLNELGKDLNLIRFVKSNIPNDQFGVNIHGNIFEALVGAIYLDRGYKYCNRFIYNRVIEPYVDIETLEGRVISYKSLLIEWCQKQKKEFNYQVYEDTGRDELKHFAVKLWIDKKVIAKARATSKKKAEEKASKRAYYALQNKMN